MLVRILLRLDPAPLARRLGRLLAQPNVLVHLAAKRQGLWEGLARESCDLVVLSRAALPGGPREVVGALRQLPDRPELIVLEEGDDPKDRAETRPSRHALPGRDRRSLAAPPGQAPAGAPGAQDPARRR